MTPRHVHVGAGALGLGLTCWTTSKLGFEVVVLNRSSSNNAHNGLINSSHTYTIEYPDHPQEPVTLAGFLYIPDELAEAERLVCDPNTVLFTTALKENGIREMLPVLRRLFQSRAKNCSSKKPLFFVACENAISSRRALALALEELSEADKRAVQDVIHPLDCVVDRICNKPVVENGKVIVVCETFSEWDIETSGLKELLDKHTYWTSKSPIKFVDSLGPYHCCPN